MAGGVFPEKPTVFHHVLVASVMGILIGAGAAFSSLNAPSGLELPGIVVASLVLSVATYYIMARLSGRTGIGLIIEVFLVIFVSSLVSWVVIFDMFR